MAGTLTLVSNEIRMLINHLTQTAKTPSLLVFYAFMIAGSFFVSNVVAILADFGGLFSELSAFLTETLNQSVIMPTVALLSVASVFSGYFSNGLTASLEPSDESLIMPAPLRPHQLLISRYFRRLIHKSAIAVILLIVLYPLIAEHTELLLPISMLIASAIVFFEFNHLLGGVMSELRNRLDHMTTSRMRHLVLPLVGAAVYLPTLPIWPLEPSLILFVPSNAFCDVFLRFAGYSVIVPMDIALAFVFVGYLIVLLLLANLCSVDFYEAFAAASVGEMHENRFSRLIRGQVDFSESRFNDPIMWVVVKDFWTRMRSPLQFWKYVYFAIGVATAVWLNIVQPTWLPPLVIPPDLSLSAVPAFLLMLVLVCQMSAMTSLLSFFDEKDNIYLLKASPFRRVDLVLAKYVGSLAEGAMALLPILGLMIYFFAVKGSMMLATLAAPLLMVFCATGVMVGAYVPVLTNDPRNAPIPLVFSFPAINLFFGGIIIVLVIALSTQVLIVIVLPSIVMLMVTSLLAISVAALKSFK